MRVLIIGCGYIGLPLGAELVRSGHQVSGLGRSAAAATDLKSADILPVTADITEPETLARLPATYDWVVNCAATAGGGVEEYRRLYLEGTQNVLSWLASAPLRRYAYTSSTSVYGQTDGSLVDETSPTHPGAETTKVLLQTESLLLEAARQKHFPAMVLRLAGIYGPGRGYWLKQFLSGEARIEGDGQRVLNMIHRDDVVGALIAALQHGESGQIYNAVDDEPVSQIDLFKWLAAKLGRELPPSAPETTEAVRKRGATNKRVSNHRLKTELGYRFKYPTFREGMV